MRMDQGGSAGTEPPPRAGNRDPRFELERLRATCRRQELLIDTLSEAVSTLGRGTKALKAENAALRAEAARLHRPQDADARPEGAELADVAIPLGIEAPGTARSIIARCLANRVAPRVVENAQLLVSELVTNSVRHCGAPKGHDVVVRVYLWRDRCRLEVQDPGRNGVITPRPPDPIRGSGIGLNLVQTLSDRWGVVREVEGPTRVWAQLSCAGPLL